MEIFLGIICIFSFISLRLACDEVDVCPKFSSWSWFFISLAVFISTFSVLIYVLIFLQPFPAPEICFCNCCNKR